MPTPQATKTEWQIASDSAFSTLVLTSSSSGYNTTYKTSITFAKNVLPYGQALYARVRHTGDTSGVSAWSDPVSFQISVPSYIIGVAMDNTNSSAKGSFFWIDALGNKLSSFDWQAHPTYKNIKMVTVDNTRYNGNVAVTLTAFPKFYIKTSAAGPAGTDADGLKCWWISSEAEAGFRPAACFKRSTAQTNGKYVISDWCYMGTFLGHNESMPDGSTTIDGVPAWIGSRRGNTVQASKTKAQFKEMIEARNDASAGVTGFRMFDIWDLGALRTLLLVAKADSDTQAVWGDNSEGTAYPLTGSTNARAVFKGTHESPQVSIEDLWRCYWYHADLITVNTGVVTLTSPMDKTSVISFGSADSSRYTQPTSSGWIRDVLDCPFTLGDDTHDLMELFLPGSVVSAENLGTFSDYHHSAATLDCVVYTGCGSDDSYPFPSETAGIFYSHNTNPNAIFNRGSLNIIAYLVVMNVIS